MLNIINLKLAKMHFLAYLKNNNNVNNLHLKALKWALLKINSIVETRDK